ncbi:MAG: sugar phosphate isomerase/epimerase [Gemmataceae bacterium]|nr:sugar phosphate isomerase/epimerase [Gemmataceae bacterium]
MARSALTISLVEQARGGPFVFWHDLAAACRETARLGFDGLEIFSPGPEGLKQQDYGNTLKAHGLKLAALGTGGGWLLHRLTLTSPDATIRSKAIEFVKGLIDAGAEFAAPAILGSLQGRHGEGVDQATAMNYLADSLHTLSRHAQARGTFLLFEPLNRYESNLVKTLAEGRELCEKVGAGDSLKLLADLYHMNIEEVGLAAELSKCGALLGHVHLADSNRRPGGCGHTAFEPIGQALKKIDFNGFVSAECLPWPDSLTAAQKTAETFTRYFR